MKRITRNCPSLSPKRRSSLMRSQSQSNLIKAMILTEPNPLTPRRDFHPPRTRSHFNLQWKSHHLRSRWNRILLPRWSKRELQDPREENLLMPKKWDQHLRLRPNPKSKWLFHLQSFSMRRPWLQRIRILPKVKKRSHNHHQKWKKERLLFQNEFVKCHYFKFEISFKEIFQNSFYASQFFWKYILIEKKKKRKKYINFSIFQFANLL